MNYSSFKGDEKQKALQKCINEFNSSNNKMTQFELCVKYGVSISALNYYKNTKKNINTKSDIEIIPLITAKIKPVPIKEIKFSGGKMTKADQMSEWIESEKEKDKQNSSNKKEEIITITYEDIINSCRSFKK